MTDSKANHGVVLVGGGYRYFSNAMDALRATDGTLPAEVWLRAHERDDKIEEISLSAGVSLRSVPAPQLPAQKIPQGTRWQWMLKPLSLPQSSIRHVILLDADNSASLDPAFLSGCPRYRETGAVFWPDGGRMETGRHFAAYPARTRIA